MDCKLVRESFTTYEVIFDGCQEKPVDMDFSLPDYCPDIQKILKCRVYPAVTKSTVVSDRLEIEGRSDIHILYLDPNGKELRACEKSSPFSMSIALKKNAENAAAAISVRVEYINCRAVSPRRLDIHGAFSVCARVTDEVTNEYIAAIDGEGIEQKTEKAEASRISASSAQMFSVSEVLELGSGKPPADHMIRSDAVAVLSDAKAVAGKVIVKGDIRIKLLYASGVEEQKLETMEYSVPFGEILDCPGANEGSQAEVELSVTDFSVSPRTDASGDSTLLESETRVLASISAYEDAEITLVTGMYSTRFETETEEKPVQLSKLVGLFSDGVTLKNDLELAPAQIESVTDIWNEIATVRADAEENKLVYRGKMNLCILAVSDGKPVYFERMADIVFEKELRDFPEEITCEAGVKVVNLSFRITSGSAVEVRAELRLNAKAFCSLTRKAIYSAYEDETRPLPERASALTVYYATPGESLWEIAKRYRTGVDAIRTENKLSSDTAEGMLLIS